MGVTDKLWDALTTVIKMNDKVVAIAGTLKEQQARIEALTERVTRLEAQIDTLLKVVTIASAGRKQIK